VNASLLTAILLSCLVAAPGKILGDGGGLERPKILRDGGGLKQFLSRLDGLASVPGSEPVRVAVFGDSHTAADLWTGVFRRMLQGRHGDGGRGFVQPEKQGAGGNPAYRFGTALYAGSGRAPEGMGIFGPGGAGLCGQVEAGTLTVEPKGLMGPGKLRLFLYSAQGTGVRVELPWKTEELPPSLAPEVRLPAYEVPDGAPVALRLTPTGSGQFCHLGLEFERPGAGVRVDTLAVNGARLGTLGKLLDSPGGGALAGLKYDLLLFVYGTNECMDRSLDGAALAQAGATVLGRVRALSPQAPCVLVGPPPFGSRRGVENAQIPVVNEAWRRASAAAGCSFLDLHAVLTDGLAFSDWLGRPAVVLERLWQRWDLTLDRELVEDLQQRGAPVFSGDGIHLARRGYELLGSLLFVLLTTEDEG
jgi:lysophospholipase L1-like esterase